jgi:hypothetical protein
MASRRSLGSEIWTFRLLEASLEYVRDRQVAEILTA